MRKLIRHALSVLLMLLFFSACGGGGGGSPPPAPPDTPSQGSSNWDEMVWDQDNWS